MKRENRGLLIEKIVREHIEKDAYHTGFLDAQLLGLGIIAVAVVIVGLSLWLSGSP